MLLGPVFSAELVTAARRPRHYAIRLIYGSAILLQVYTIYRGYAPRSGPGGAEPTLDQMAHFGMQMFSSFAVLQAIAVLMLTPALVGGSIAEERRRKTLHYLLASQLTGFEIVVGKLAARLLQVVVLVALGMPVVALVGLFGGVDFGLLAGCYAGTLSTVYFLAGLSILMSCWARRPREAIMAIYLIELAWLFGPMVLMDWLPRLQSPWPTVAEWINPALRWLASSSPASLAWSAVVRGGRISGLSAAVAEMIALQLAYGTIFVLIAALRLRPAFRAEAGERPRPRWLDRLTARRRWLARPPIGDRPMLWKERHVARSTGLTRVATNVLALVVLGFVGYWTYWYFVGAAGEAMRSGFSGGGPDRVGFNSYLRVVSVILYVLWFFGVASTSAGVITSEREDDTWLSLTATTLEADEILRAKMLGPVWGLRGVVYLLGLLWALGLAVGSISMPGVLLCAFEFAVFTWFLVALGTTFSLHSKTTTRSLAATMGILIFLNGGYLFCLASLGPGGRWMSAGVTPALFGGSLMGYDELAQAGHDDDSIVAVLLGLTFYTISAAALTLHARKAFDDRAGRPNRLNRGKPPDWARTGAGARKPPGPGDELA